MLGTLAKFFAIGLVALVALGLVLSALGAAFSLALGLASFLLFKVAPLVFLGWVVLKFLNRGESASGITAADEAWLEERR